MNTFVTIGIGIAVVIIASAGIYVYSTTSSIPQTVLDDDSGKQISFEEKIKSETIPKEPKIKSFNVTENMGIEQTTP